MLAWLYGLNLLLALIGTLTVEQQWGKILDHSLAAAPLVKGFDLAAFLELISAPGVSLGSHFTASFLLALLFLFAALFTTGGVLEVFRYDRPFKTAEFFQACGAYLRPFLRLLLFFLMALIPVGICFSGVQAWSGKLSSESSWELLGFWVQLGGMVVVLFLLMAVRLWFDMAQVCAVAEAELRMRRALIQAFKLVWGNFRRLFWIFLRVAVVAPIGLALAITIWVKWVRPEWVIVSFLLGQVVLFLGLAIRLWLRACETLWFQRYGPAMSPEYLDKLVA